MPSEKNYIFKLQIPRNKNKIGKDPLQNYFERILIRLWLYNTVVVPKKSTSTSTTPAQS